jgi:hypothetical protein
VRLSVSAAVVIFKRAVAAVVLVLPAVTIIIIVVVVPAAFVLVKRLVGALNDLIKLAAIEPYAATLRAVINFNALAIGDGQENVAFWTIHGVVLAASENSGDPGLSGSPDQNRTIEYFGLYQAIAFSRRP